MTTKSLTCVLWLLRAAKRSQFSRFLHICRRLLASWGKLGDWTAWILREVSRRPGNLDAARSGAAVRPGRTRKVGVRDARRADPGGLKSVKTKPKFERCKPLPLSNLRASGGYRRAAKRSQFSRVLHICRCLAASQVELGDNADYRGGVTCLYDTQLLGTCLHPSECGGRSRPQAVRGMPDVPIAPPATGPPERAPGGVGGCRLGQPSLFQQGVVGAFA